MHSAMQAAPLTIIFDLDGTLVDTAPDLLGALNWVLVAEGHEPVVPKDLRHMVGHGAKAMFEHALLRTGASVAPERLAALTQRFLGYYRANIARGSRPPYSKPDPRHVLAVVTALNGRPDRAVLVGDSQIDVTAARAAGIPVIVMSYGYTPVPVAELGADAVVDDFAALPEIISGLVEKNCPD